MIIIYILFLIILILYASIFFIKYTLSSTKTYHIRVEVDGNNKKKKIIPQEEQSEMQRCRQYCKKDVCDKYSNVIYNYDSCNTCAEKNLCWSELQRTCIKCNENTKSCNEKYGCYNKEDDSYNGPINPGDNFCKLCNN